MSEVHKCLLHKTDTSGLKRLPPNASCFKRWCRKLRKLIIVNPNNSKCNSFLRNKSAILAEQRKHIRSPFKYIIHPFSKLSSLFEVCFVVVWFCRMLYSPIAGNMFERNGALHYVDQYGLIMIQYVIIIMFFFVGYVDRKRNEIVVDHRKITCNYLRTFFIFDVISTEILESITLEIIRHTVSEGTLKTRLKMLILYIEVPCLYVRLYNFLDQIEYVLQMLGAKMIIRKCIHYIVKTYMYLHVFGSMLYLVPQVVYLNDFPGDSWLVKADIQPMKNMPFSKSYGECFLMAMCFFFGASGGQYIVDQTNEQICLSFIGFFGRMYTLFMLADALRMFGIVGVSEGNYEKQLVQLKEYMMSNNLPPTLRGRMIRYYENKLQKRWFNEKKILNSLSDSLRAEIFLFSATKLMQKSNVFKYLPKEEIANIISMMRLETYAPGDVIFKVDQAVEYIYFISCGSVAMLNKRGQELCHLEDGDVFGLCMSTTAKHSFTAVVIETTDIFVTNTSEFVTFLSDYPQAAEYMENLATKRYLSYKKLEQNIKNKMDDCLLELKKGVLLEKKRKRNVIVD